MTDEERLKPCPFCGGTDIRHDCTRLSGHAFMLCDDCGAEGPSVDTDDEAIAAWNRRHTQEPDHD